MKQPKGIDPTQAREKQRSGRAVLVCAHDSEEKCLGILLDGAITLTEFQAAADPVDEDREIILFCSSSEQGTSRHRAEELQRLGFGNTRYLVGGVEAWKKSGFPLAAETSPQNPAHA